MTFFFSLSYLSNSVLDLIVGKSQQFFLILQNPVEFEIDLTGLMFFLCGNFLLFQDLGDNTPQGKFGVAIIIIKYLITSNKHN
jgi:hypothetical protein